MGSKFLRQTVISDFNVLTWKSKPVFYYYDTICAFLKENKLESVVNILAIPQHKLEANRIVSVDWIAPIKIINTIQSFDLLTNEEKSTIRNKISQVNLQLDKLITILKTNEEKENRDWAELLSFITFYPDDEFIYSDGNNIFITAWGFNSKKQLALKDIEGKVNLEEDIVPRIPEESIVEKIDVGSDIENKSEEFIDTKETDIHNVQNDEDITIYADSKAEDDQQLVEKVKKKGSWWWWLLLLLMLILIALFSLKTCAQKSGNILPAPNVIVPIDSTKIELDKDSIAYIVQDRLNIIFKNNAEFNMQRFSDDFKIAFPDSEYKIIYYDSLTHRTQISTPKDKMEETKALLKTRLSQYEMIIFQENIFNNRMQANDPGFSDLSKSWFLERIRAFQAWDITTGSKDIVIAVLDDGFDIAHPELQGKIFKPYNVVNRNTDVFTYKQSTHGTHVAATAIGTINNSLGVSGSAPNCMLMPIQISDSYGQMSTTSIVDGLLYAIYQGADVINMSLGMYFSPLIGMLPDDVQYNLKENIMKEEEEFWNSIYDIAEENNVTIIIAGGNQSIVVGLDPKDRSDYVINVSASDEYDQRAQFSNYGFMSDVTAPGTKIFSAIPGNKYESYDGTSMAAPLVTGGIALMKSLDSNLTPQQIKLILDETGLTLNTDKPIGRLLQLDAALKLIQNGGHKNNDNPCAEVAIKIAELERQIEELKALCPDLKFEDTLKIPDHPSSLEFLKGFWKSTSPIKNFNDEAVVLYFNIDPLNQSQLRLEDPTSGSCLAEISLSLHGREFTMDQSFQSICQKDNKKYYPYFFKCEADIGGKAVCFAQNKNNKHNYLEFNLIRIK